MLHCFFNGDRICMNLNVSTCNKTKQNNEKNGLATESFRRHGEYECVMEGQKWTLRNRWWWWWCCCGCPPSSDVGVLSGWVDCDVLDCLILFGWVYFVLKINVKTVWYSIFINNKLVGCIPYELCYTSRMYVYCCVVLCCVSLWCDSFGANVRLLSMTFIDSSFNYCTWIISFIGSWFLRGSLLFFSVIFLYFFFVVHIFT